MTLDNACKDRQVRLGGIGQVVADEIQQRLSTETRCVVLGHLQRGGQPTYFDRMLATQYGVHAVRLIEEQRFGEMVCYDPPEIGSIPISQAVDRLSTVDPLGSAVVAARGLGVSFGDTRPLRIRSRNRRLRLRLTPKNSMPPQICGRSSNPHSLFLP